MREGAPEPAFAARIATTATLARRVAELPRPLVFTNGVFDVLHRGHVTYLDHARSLGAALVVGVNSDASARRLGKGTDRPLNPLEDRLAAIGEPIEPDAHAGRDRRPARIVLARPHDGSLARDQR